MTQIHTYQVINAFSRDPSSHVNYVPASCDFAKSRTREAGKKTAALAELDSAPQALNPFLLSAEGEERASVAPMAQHSVCPEPQAINGPGSPPVKKAQVVEFAVAPEPVTPRPPRPPPKTVYQTISRLSTAEKVGYALVAIPMLPLALAFGPLLLMHTALEKDNEQYYRGASRARYSPTVKKSILENI